VKEDKQTIGGAVGRILSGCCVLTAQHDGRSNGVLVSWVQQAAFEPLSVTACLKKERPAVELVEASKKFMLNVIGEDAANLLKHFRRGFSTDQDSFAGLGVRDTEFGPLIESCIAHVGCKVVNKVTVGDHYLYVGEVAAGGCVENAKPFVHRRMDGFSY
jgi:flavin reductase (DIM6/NTAB) family NADH-FMN oxidoreductase RutF